MEWQCTLCDVFIRILLYPNKKSKNTQIIISLEILFCQGVIKVKRKSHSCVQLSSVCFIIMLYYMLVTGLSCGWGEGLLLIPPSLGSEEIRVPTGDANMQRHCCHSQTVNIQNMSHLKRMSYSWQKIYLLMCETVCHISSESKCSKSPRLKNDFKSIWSFKIYIDLLQSKRKETAVIKDEVGIRRKTSNIKSVDRRLIFLFK